MVELPHTFSEQIVLFAAMARYAIAVAVVRYAVLAVAAFYACYVVFRARLAQRHIAREIFWSLASCTIFGLIDVAVTLLSVTGYMQARVLDPSPAWPEFVGTVIVLLVVHDAYFYWAHRLMHWRPLYRLAHATHHRSTQPTPFAAFAFHPVEAVIEYAFVPIVALLAPIHVLPLLVFGVIMTAMNVYAHLGIELMPSSFIERGLGRVLLTPTHHDLHHTMPQYDFAFYFNIWDRLMGTLNPSYEAEFARVTSWNSRGISGPTNDDVTRPAVR
jgi:sterol desaturase/sphingolipid hydroxylase (fatty acid hydroxylase superfamily)